jgi:FAD/FMN-containing dehydrogenase
VPRKTTHEEKVRKIAQQIQTLKTLGDGGVEFKKSSVSHLVPNPYRGKLPPRIDLQDLREIIEIDKEGMTCTAESGIPFVDLVRETLKHGLIPHTVPELKTITIGGAVSGCSVEAMSYKYGGFHDTCLEYEAVTGKGYIITCSPDSDPDLFHMIHGSYGTLALITQIKFNLLQEHPGQA